MGFVRAMDEFRGMKLVRKFVDKTQAINITVNFDTSKHLSDAQIQRRERVRKRLLAKAKAEEDEIEKLKKMEQDNMERQRFVIRKNCLMIVLYKLLILKTDVFLSVSKSN